MFFPLDIAEVSESLPESLDGKAFAIGSPCQITDSRNLSCLLRLDGNEKREEQSAKSKQSYQTVGTFNPKSKIENPKWVHLITLSALASRVGGMLAPICFAVFKLITISNLVGCSTGMSAGLAPFKILAR